MRTFTMLCTALALSTSAVRAQSVATFESLALPGTDTFYVNYSAPGTDVGFDDGLAHFPCVYDTGFGLNFLSYGFVYSSKVDSVTSGFGNQYSAKAAKGFGGSSKYAVAYCYNPITFNNTLNLPLTGAAIGKKVSGFYVTNSTYAYNSMRDGDGFGKKFGGTTGTDPDWFKLKVRGYLGGTLKTDSVVFFLADFRAAGTATDYIVKDWRWVNLLPLGNVDSLQFSLSSSDVGSFGMNTPSYFCMDDLNTNATASVAAPVSYVAKVYPNPAVDVLHVQLNDNTVTAISITDVEGNTVAAMPVTSATISVSTASFAPGVYMLHISGANGTAASRFVKQ